MNNSFTSRSTAEEVMRGVDLSGKVVLVTGCNSGLGFETVRVLAEHGAHVLAAARNLSTAQGVRERVRGSVTPLACDLSDLSAVDRAIADLVAGGWRIDRVIANAGVMAPPHLETCHGLEKQFVVNYLGHFRLINGILGLIPTHAGARIVIVASSAHRRAPKGGVELDNLRGERGYNPSLAYGQSNVARILFARALARRLLESGICVNSLHPGIIAGTKLFRYMNPLLVTVIRLFSKTVEQGAATQCFLAAHPDVANVTGRYFSDCRESEPSRAAQDDALGERLWRISEQLVESHAE